MRPRPQSVVAMDNGILFEVLKVLYRICFKVLLSSTCLFQILAMMAILSLTIDRNYGYLKCVNALSASAIPRRNTNFKSNEGGKLNSEEKYVSSYFATCIPGLEEILASELQHKDVGAHNIHIHRAGVSFTENEIDDFSSDQNDLIRKVGLRALMWCRVPHMILERVLVQNIDDEEGAVAMIPEADDIVYDKEQLYAFIHDHVDVESTFLMSDVMPTLSCRCIMQRSHELPEDLTHSHYTALTVKNAIVDKCRDMSPSGERPDVDTVNADVPFVIVLRGSIDNSRRNPAAEVTLYKSLSGSRSMHRRGYRQNMSVHKAAMKESMASALLLAAGWDKLVNAAKNDGKPAVLIDPMMGRYE